MSSPRRRHGWRMRALLASAALGLAGAVAAQDAAPEPAPSATPDARAPFTPPLAPASDEWRAALAAMSVPERFEVELFAAEPRLANPVCLTVADDGSVYVGETFRHHAGVTDIREHWDWLDADLASRTVADRVAYMAALTGDDFASYAGHTDRLRLLRDTDGDGRADFDTVFADGFDDTAAGIGAGVLSYRGEVFYTCIPDLWSLRDDDGDGHADRRRSLSTGYGVHTGLLGHDLHGPVIGPDRRLYFSMGDRGLHVETPTEIIAHPHTGAVLRCELDGSQLEVFHTGLRNPQELAFDDLGDLFTGDNNSDGGDQARWVRCLSGGDSGWRFSYQWLEAPRTRGPWNAERLWEPRHPHQAAYILPPIANIANGPSGLAYYPGTGFGPAWKGHFFLCDFGGGPQWSGIHTFVLEPDGAGHRMIRREHFLWDVLVTDAGFGPDGNLYLTDWVEGWNQTGKGRVWRVEAPLQRDATLVAQTRRLLAEGMGARPIDELLALLRHADLRVRQAAQFELADRGDDGVEALTDAARRARTLTERLHGIWGLWVAGRRDARTLEPLVGLARDPEPEVRAQALKVLGDLAYRPARTMVLTELADPAPRARFWASIAAGRLGLPEAVDPLLDILRETGARDPNLRHAAVMGLVGCSEGAALMAYAGDPSPHVRTGLALALRRLESPLLATYLGRLARSDDPEDAWIALEVARAIHDIPVRTATPALAALLDAHEPLLARFLGDDALPTDAFVRRLVAANLTLGKSYHAQRVAAFAARDDAPPDLLAEALDVLTHWAEPSPRDMVMGDWRPIAPRPAPFLEELAAELAAGDLGRAPESVRLAFLRLLERVGTDPHQALLHAWLADGQAPAAVRARCLQLLRDADVPDFDALLATALGDADGGLRAAALPLLLERSPADAARFVPTILAVGEIAERRAAYEILASPGVDPELVGRLLGAELQRMRDGLVSPELHLDLVLAAEPNGMSESPAMIGRYAAAWAHEPGLAYYLDCLFGGDAERGRALFESTGLACQRCHAVDAGSGFRVGPALEGLGGRRTRLQMLTSIVDPNRSLAPGFEGTNLFLRDGGVLSGRVVAESDDALTLLDADGNTREVPLADVDERRSGLSAMPEELTATLDRRQMRDLLAYLAGL